MVATLIVPWRGSASGWGRRGRRRRVGVVVEAVEEVRRLACDHDDRPGGPRRMISSGVSNERPWRCSSLPAIEVPGLNAWLEWRERLAVSKEIV